MTESAPAAVAAPTTVDEGIAAVEEQFSIVFNRARALWSESAKQIHPELQPAGYKLLGMIVRAGRANAHVLADQLMMDKSAVSRQVRLLEDAGLVESLADEHDRRVRVLVPTAVAIERINAVRDRNQERLRGALRDRSVAELASFAEILRAIGTA
ncbi:MarR family winged helix-turn-helix transcriptional regulator [Agromyces protaetiae]|uniref:MarR family winged helix-turn-helix transcriptional regulator n=1 Tax=Agromyces protaetiae TaxID=2509455 RepID=UPI001FB61BCF|nr:MarR family transcriptional regulator [Agromyces protaetiae]